MSVPGVRHLCWRHIAPDSAFHAALFADERSSGHQITLHDHDFAEMLLITAGEGTHLINGRRVPLTPGTLWFIRPPDTHGIVIPTGGKLHWINVAFPADGWNDFARAAGISPDWHQESLPPQTVLPSTRLPIAVALFETALRAYVARNTAAPPSRFALCRFLSEAIALLPDVAPADIPDPLGLPEDAPDWLREACSRLAQDPERLREGLSALRDAAPVSEGHLARALKSATGQTPTEYVNSLRLARAAERLAATALPITTIAAECGFAQLSYFYRLFVRRYGASPHAYRRAARRPVAPSTR